MSDESERPHSFSLVNVSRESDVLIYYESRCSCGWKSGETQGRGAATTRYQQHLREVEIAEAENRGRASALRELEELRARAQIAEDNLAPLAKENYAVKADNRALRARLAAMVERVERLIKEDSYHIDGWECGELGTCNRSHHRGHFVQVSDLREAVEEIGKPDPGASPNPRDWPGGVPTDPRPYFEVNPLTTEEERYAASVAGEEGPPQALKSWEEVEPELLHEVEESQRVTGEDLAARVGAGEEGPEPTTAGVESRPVLIADSYDDAKLIAQSRGLSRWSWRPPWSPPATPGEQEPMEPEPDDLAPPCESCGKPSTGRSLDDVPLCEECGKALEAEAAEPERQP